MILEFIVIFFSDLFEKGENTNGLGENKKDGYEKRNDEEREIYREDRGGTIKRYDEHRSKRKVGFGNSGNLGTMVLKLKIF